MSKQFRADVVGSFLRPTELKEARAKFAEGKISAEDASHRGGSSNHRPHRQAESTRLAFHHRRRVQAQLLASRLHVGIQRSGAH